MDIEPLSALPALFWQGFFAAPTLAWLLVGLGTALAILSSLTAWAALAGRLLKALQRVEGRRTLAGALTMALLATLLLYLGVDALIGSPTRYFQVAQTEDNPVVPQVIMFARLLVIGSALWPPLLCLALGLLLGTAQGRAKRPAAALVRLGVLLGYGFAFWWPRPALPQASADEAYAGDEATPDYELTLASGEAVEAEEREYIENILELGETTARDVMRPRPDVVAVDVGWAPQRIIDVVAGSRHSRFPVYEETIDNVVGVLHLRDLLEFLARGDSVERLQPRELLMEALFVPEGKKADDILRLLQKSKSHLAVVLDEYGGTAGILTIEDLLEEIVGEIQDEYDDEAKLYYQREDGAWIVDAQLPLGELNELLDAAFELADVDTLGGLVTSALGRIPEAGETLLVDAAGLPVEEEAARYRCTVLSVERNRVGRVQIDLL